MDYNTQHENKSRVEWDYNIGDKVLLCKEGILRKSESKYYCDPGLYQQSIQMEQSGFIAEQNQND